jgi:glycosyltransferase involved in cell wall biosynthesis
VPEISIVVPAYNEEAAIAADLRALEQAFDSAGADYEIVVVDDGSTDRTAEMVAGFPRVRLVRHPENRGSGAARNTGIRFARGRWIGMTDGDGTYPVAELPRLIALLDSSDMVLGARRREMGTWPWLRTPAKWFIRKLAEIVAQRQIPDLNTGFRAFRKELAEQFFYMLPSTHSWVSTITLAFLTHDYRVHYVPIDYFARRGRSSFHPIRDTFNYLTLVIRAVMYFKPLRIFVPLSGLLLLAGILRMIRDWLRFGPLGGFGITLLVLSFLVGVLGLLAESIVVQGKRARPALPPEPHP